MPAPATSDELFEVIARSGLLPEELLHTYRPPPGRLVNADAVLAKMTRDGVITPFHAKHLAAGRHRGFFLTEKYKLLAHLGTGGIGQVYLAEHLLLHRLVAVKVLQAAAAQESAGVVERFFREARAVATLDDPNIVRVFDMDRAGGVPFMVMEYVDGTNLHAVVALGGPLPVARAANYARQAALGLQHAHEAGLVHRDVKPGNLLVDRGGTVKLLDLGLARFFAEPDKNKNLTAQFDAKNIVGTADFIAPEQTHDSSNVDIRADVYSLGGTLYYLLVGRSPFEGGSVAQKLLWHQTKPPPPLADYRDGVPAALAAVVSRMLAKEPADRYPTPAAVADALAPWGAEKVPPPDPGEMPRMPPSAYRLGLSPPPSGSQARSATNIPVVAAPPATRPGVSASDQTTAELKPPSPDGSTLVSPTVPEPPASTPAAPAVRPEQSPPPVADRRRPWLLALLLLLLAVNGVILWRLFGTAAAPPPPPADVPYELTVGGSTFVQRVMQAWAKEYAAGGVRLAPYAAVGSGRGLSGLREGAFHVGCTDVPPTDAELAEASRQGKRYVHVPLVTGAVVPAYNLPGVKAPLRFTGEVLAAIFQGDITAWDDPALQRLNDRADLPKLPIRVVYRTDASGTTAVWSDFLSRHGGPRWKEAAGEPTGRLPVPVGSLGAEGGEQLAEVVAADVGRLGYVELSVALEQNLSVGWVQNLAGEFVRPSLTSVTAAAAAARSRINVELRYSLIDPPGAASYPVCGTTWAVFDAAHPDARQRNAVAQFLWWATHDGQRRTAPFQFAPLDPDVVTLVEGKLRDLRR